MIDIDFSGIRVKLIDFSIALFVHSLYTKYTINLFPRIYAFHAVVVIEKTSNRE